jgi:phosphoribosylanthranilate isomerase
VFPKVKICGLMNSLDAKMCVSYGADILGFVVEYPRPVPWDISARTAKALVGTVPKPAQSCVVTGGAPDKVLRLAREIMPDYIQLHCGESLSDTAYIAAQLKGLGIKVIKTVFPDTPDLIKTAADFCETGIYALLFDPRTPDNAAQGGAVDTAAFIELKNSVNLPVILAGGINPENAAEIVSRTGAAFIDLMTGVETRPGAKDGEKVKALFETLRGAKAQLAYFPDTYPAKPAE